MTSIERTFAEIAAALLLFGLFVIYLEHRGAEACLNKDASVAAHQEEQTAVKTALATNTITIERDAYVEAKLVPVADAPDVTCVRHTPGAVLQTTATGPGDDGRLRLPARDSGPVELSPHIAENTIAIGRDANAQVKALKDYIYKVCLQ